MTSCPMVNNEYTNDSEELKASGAIKYDGGKSPVFRGALALLGSHTPSSHTYYETS